MMGLGRRFRRGGRTSAHGSGQASGAEDPWLRRQVRGLRPDRNPLRRRIDRVEAYLITGLFVATVAGTPLAAQSASRSAYAGALRTQQEQLASTHQVTATLTQAAGSAMSGYTLSTDVPVKASWPTSAGKRKSAEVLAKSGASKGTPVTVWIDSSGDLAIPPLTAAQVAGQGDAGAIGAVAGVTVMFLTGAGVLRYVLYRRRMAAWEADWLLTAPTWNRQSS